MRRQVGDDGEFAALAIVSVITRLIFSDVEDFGLEELRVVEALRAANDKLLGANHDAIGDYLRTLGTGELTLLVAELRHRLHHGPSGAPGEHGHSRRGRAPSR